MYPSASKKTRIETISSLSSDDELLLDDLECLDVFETRFGGVLDLLEAISLDLDLLDLEDLDDFLDS